MTYAPGMTWAFALALCAIINAEGFAAAEQVQTLPSQQIPPPQQLPPPIQRQPNETAPIPPTLPGAQGNTREIPLPEVFRGCWIGLVTQVDSIVPLNPDVGNVIWLTKSYTLCYKQSGYNGKWQLTFAEGSVADRSEVSDQRQVIRVQSVSGGDRAQLSAYLHFRARQPGIFGMSGRVNIVDELAHLTCLVMPDNNVMMVGGQVFVEYDGRSWANIKWHTRFTRTVASGG
jgi:hypothetical protein